MLIIVVPLFLVRLLPVARAALEHSASGVTGGAERLGASSQDDHVQSEKRERGQFDMESRRRAQKDRQSESKRTLVPDTSAQHQAAKWPACVAFSAGSGRTGRLRARNATEYRESPYQFAQANSSAARIAK
jgi:hypothetical protein